ncbi:MAG: ComEC/Rec2 family competence protein [Candidatus Moranbacteria bacterium]|nr:ComEC/Rec2 family competence protein [Candidatus Moranbacteria bacterium]
MDKAKIFLVVSLSFIGGVFGASFFYPNYIPAIFAQLVLLSAVIIFFVFYRNKKAIFITLALLLFAAGFFVTQKRIDKIASFENAPEAVDFSGRGMVVAEPKIKDSRQDLIFKPNNTDYNILIQESAYKNFAYGDELELKCQLAIPKNMADSTFDYKAYLARQDIFYLCQKPQIEKTGQNLGNGFYATVVALKNKFSAKIYALIPSPEAGLLEGLIIGGSGNLSKEIQADFSRTGMTHIVAVSGYNITIVAQYLMILGFFIGLWRRQAFWFALIGIWIFILMTGFPTSAIRAGVMGTLLLYAMKNGRLANAGNAIIFSATVMLWWNPLLLRYDVGFQLSFLATIGIVYFYPIFEKFFGEKLKKYPTIISLISEILFMSLSAQIFVLPIILFNFQALSLISPVTNILVLPILPFTMLIGFLAVAVSFIFQPLAVLFSWLAYLSLRYEIFVIHYFANLKFSALAVGLSWQGMVIWYIILVGGVYYLKKKTNETSSSPSGRGCPEDR